MALEATLIEGDRPAISQGVTAAALVPGEVIQSTDGRPAVVAGLGGGEQGYAIGDDYAVFVSNTFAFATDEAWTAGDVVSWVIAENLANAVGDFVLGTCKATSAINIPVVVDLESPKA